MNGEKLRRAKRTYIRLAAHLAAQPDDVERVVMSLAEIKEVLGESLPPHASFPFWWNNEGLTVHSRAWLSSGWQVAEMDPDARRVEFTRGISQ